MIEPKRIGAVALAAVGALAVLSGCGGSEATADSDRGPSESVALNVVMSDTGSLDALYNFGRGRCYTAGAILDIIGESRRLEVVVKDADGSIVGEVDVPKHGGSFDKQSGCEWPVPLDVPRSGAYEVSVSDGHDVLATETVTVADDAAEAEASLSLDQ